MFQPLICGGFNHHQEEEDDDNNELCSSSSSSSNSTPRKSRKSSFCKSRNKETKNPYSNRGLDKFSALLSELEDKRQKIYLQTSSPEDISLVRFKYKNSTDCVPVVVKLKDKKEEPKAKAQRQERRTQQQQQKPQVWENHPVETLIEPEDVMTKTSSEKNTHEENKNRRFPWNVELRRRRRPYYYLAAFCVLILVLLVFFGRSVSVLFTCVGWYIVPTIQRGSSNTVMKKKDYARKLSNESEVVRSKNSSPLRDHHRKS